MNLDTPTAAITGTLVTEIDYHLVAKELEEECDGTGSIFRPTERLCTQLRKCFSRWADVLGPLRAKQTSEEL
jgi:hypothetical protein